MEKKKKGVPIFTRAKAAAAPRLDIPVTAEMIARAIPKDSSHCMIADAVKVAIPHAHSIAVDLATIRFTDSAKGCRYIYLTPPIAQIALLNFDNEIIPKPFRVKATAAQIVESKPAKKRRRNSESSSVEEQALEVHGNESSSVEEQALEVHGNESSSVEPLDTLGRPLSKKRQMAKLIPNTHSGKKAVPIKLGGMAPPLGPLARGSGVQNTRDYKIGRKRSFGLRILARSEQEIPF